MAPTAYGSNRKQKRSELQNENPNSGKAKCQKPRLLKKFCVQSPPSPHVIKQVTVFSSSSQNKSQKHKTSKPEASFDITEESLMTAAFTPNTKSRAPQVCGRDFFKEL